MATYDYTFFAFYLPPSSGSTLESFDLINGGLTSSITDDNGDDTFSVNEAVTFDGGLEGIYLGTTTLATLDGNVTFLVIEDTNTVPGSIYLIGSPTDTSGSYFPSNTSGFVIVAEDTIECFTRGTHLSTPDGERLVDELEVGDLIQTVDGRAVPIRWIGSTKVSASRLARDESLRPVRFAAGSLGGGLPKRDMLVSPQHGIHVTDWRAEMLFDTTEVLVPAINLVNDDTIRQVSPEDGVEYFHILCDAHELVATEGYATETYFPDPHSRMRTVSEIETLFPDLAARIEDGDFAEATVRIGSMKTAALKELG